MTTQLLTLRTSVFVIPDVALRILLKYHLCTHLVHHLHRVEDTNTMGVLYSIPLTGLWIGTVKRQKTQDQGRPKEHREKKEN